MMRNALSLSLSIETLTSIGGMPVNIITIVGLIEDILAYLVNCSTTEHVMFLKKLLKLLRHCCLNSSITQLLANILRLKQVRHLLLVLWLGFVIQYWKKNMRVGVTKIRAQLKR
jgi:hypothetical protein